MIDMNTAAATVSVPQEPSTCSYVWTRDFTIQAVPCADEARRERAH